MRNNKGELLILYVLVGLLTAAIMTIQMMLAGCKETTKAGIRTCVEKVEEASDSPTIP